MNVIGARPDKWWNDPDEAMRKLAARLDGYARTSGDDVTIVFDRDPGRLPELERARTVVARRRGRNAADHEIRVIVAADPRPESLLVVTSDRRLADTVRALGARVVPSGAFRSRVETLVPEAD